MASAVGHVVAEFIQNSILDDALNGNLDLDPNNPQAIAKYINQKKDEAIAIGKAVGGATVLLTQEGVTDEELARATDMAGSVIENNTFGAGIGIIIALVALSENANTPSIGDVPKTGLPLAGIHPAIDAINTVYTLIESGTISPEQALYALSKKLPNIPTAKLKQSLDNVINKVDDTADDLLRSLGLGTKKPTLATTGNNTLKPSTPTNTRPNVVKQSSGNAGGSGTNGTFTNNPKHGSTKKGNANPTPTNPQKALDDSIPLSDNTTRRVSVDKKTNEYIILGEHRPGEFHGHTRSWKELTPKMQAVLRKAGLVNKKGKIQ